MSAQLVLLFVVASALLFKRFRERPRRPWNVWGMDISKQACSGGAGHAVGMTVAILAHIYSKGASECGWYFVVYFADCTIGLALAITFHKVFTGLAAHGRLTAQLAGDKGHAAAWWDALVEIGNYGDPPQVRRWMIQVVFWMSCVVTARVIVGCIVVSSIPVLSIVTDALDDHFEGHPEVFLFTVMVAIPVVVNVGQAWIQDQVLKWSHRQTKEHRGSPRVHTDGEHA
ncbi:hypothetical protein FOA52_011038 [Chlamydomonas sp. UWO 241]|nr:hypothetical protein FOA52_011038 [Chlamydomonas sp. UWO 241]